MVRSFSRPLLLISFSAFPHSFETLQSFLFAIEEALSSYANSFHSPSRDAAVKMTDNVGLAVFIIGGTLGVLSILTTALRCYTRVFIVKSFGLDDWFMLLALVSRPCPRLLVSST